MSTNEAYKHIAHYKFNYNKPISVTTNVKHIMLVSDRINRTKTPPHFRKRMPIGLFHHLIPAFKRNFSILTSRLFVVFFQCPMRNNPHTIIHVTKSHKYSVIQNLRLEIFLKLEL